MPYTPNSFEVPTVEAIESVLNLRAYQYYKLTKAQTENDPGFKSLSKEVQNILSALKAGRSVFFVLQKWPKGDLSKGRHWFDLYYVTEEGRAAHFWPWCEGGAKIMGMDTQDRDRSMHRFIFSSGAIGMDRFLSATGNLSRVLAECCGIERGDTAFQFSSSDCL